MIFCRVWWRGFSASYRYADGRLKKTCKGAGRTHLYMFSWVYHGNMTPSKRFNSYSPLIKCVWTYNVYILLFNFISIIEYKHRYIGALSVCMSVCVCVCLPVCLSVCLQDLVQLMWNLAWLCQLKQNSNPLFHIYDLNNHICCFNYKSLSASCHRAIALCKIYHKIKHTEQHYRYTDIFISQNPKALPGEIVLIKSD